ncbi:uncharacterized protein VTP21DRAFT_3761 [Calcarisporiella thermophila]|uniref:uncharacterized protein n=1 Tax=Calcarisporiella thermophila TaxID=911321 RepID=UPI0037423FD6
MRPFKRTLGKRTRLWIIRFGIPLLMLICLGAAIGVTYYKFREESELNLEKYSFNVSSRTEGKLGIINTPMLVPQLHTTVYFADLEKSILKMKHIGIADPDLFKLLQANSLIPNLHIIINGNIIILNSTFPILGIDQEAGFDNGTSSNYPYDKYELTYIEAAYAINTAGDFVFLPVDINITSVQQSFRFQAEESSDTKNSSPEQNEFWVELTIKVKQTTFTKWFSIFIAVLMWLITLVAAVVSYQIVIFGRVSALEDVAVLAALLFALPSVRKTMPGVPSKVGTLLDMLGFIWNIAILSICVIVAFSAWMSKWKHERMHVD